MACADIASGIGIRPAAGRTLWAYGPNQRDITVLAIEPHPEDQKRGAYQALNCLPCRRQNRRQWKSTAAIRSHRSKGFRDFKETSHCLGFLKRWLRVAAVAAEPDETHFFYRIFNLNLQSQNSPPLQPRRKSAGSRAGKNIFSRGWKFLYFS